MTTLATDVSSQASTLTGAEIQKRELGTPDAAVVRNLVTTGWTSAQTYAASSFAAATSQLAALAGAAATIANIGNIDANLAPIADAASGLSAAFNEAAPQLSITLAYTDAEYTDPQFVALKAQLNSWIAGNFTGLHPDIEAALWQRGRAREMVVANKKSQEVLRQFAMRGFSKPPGALALQLLEAQQELQDKDSSFSRDVAIKQADLMQSNRRFAFDLAERLQGALIQYATAKQARVLDAVKTVQQLSAEIHGHLVQAYTARANSVSQRYGAEAQLVRAHADVEIAQGNIRIEAAKATIQALIQKATLLVESIRASAQISGQLAASALSAVNLSGGLHDSTAWGVSVSDARSRSTSVAIGSQSNRQENYTP